MAGCALSPLLFNIVLLVIASAIKQQKEIKGIQIGKVEAKLSLFTDDMTLYRKPKDFTPKLLELIQEFSKVVEYEHNAHNSIAFLYTKNEAEKRSQGISPIYNCTQNRKIPRN